jgi:hypothetical protein
VNRRETAGFVAVLAPTGKLRVGVYPGSPLSMLTDRTTGDVRGLQRFPVILDHSVIQYDRKAP